MPTLVAFERRGAGRGILPRVTLVDLAAVSLAVAGAAAVQTAIGFGFGLVLVPIFLALGHGLPEAIAITLGASLWQTSIGLYTVRSATRFRETFPLVVVQWLTLPVGIAVMNAMVASGPGRVKQGVGLVLLAVLTMRLVAKPTPRDRIPLGYTLLAASSSGVLSGAVGMGGPPLVLLALAQRLAPDRYRAFLWEQFLLISPVQLGVLLLGRGVAMLEAFGLGVALVPALFVGVKLGRAVSDRWDAVTLSRAAMGMLYAIAFASLLAPMLER